MALNNFTIKEAINICCDISQNLKLNKDLPLVEKYAEKDALDQLINFAKEIILKNGKDA